MTDIEWGNPIEVNGVRPEWLKDGDEWEWKKGSRNFVRATSFLDAYSLGDWATFASIRLPANHPYYLATSKGFTYWPGGDEEPKDYDMGEVLLEMGVVEPYFEHHRWSRSDYGSDIIGYHKKQTPTKTQVDGTHYTKLAIQPFEYSMANNLDPLQHTIIKYTTRFRGKNGIVDLRKAIHCLEMLIEFEESK